MRSEMWDYNPNSSCQETQQILSNHIALGAIIVQMQIQNLLATYYVRFAVRFRPPCRCSANTLTTGLLQSDEQFIDTRLAWINIAVLKQRPFVL